jgi:hypothetical protein
MLTGVGATCTLRRSCARCKTMTIPRTMTAASMATTAINK